MLITRGRDSGQLREKKGDQLVGLVLGGSSDEGPLADEDGKASSKLKRNGELTRSVDVYTVEDSITITGRKEKGRLKLWSSAS